MEESTTTEVMGSTTNNLAIKDDNRGDTYMEGVHEYDHDPLK